MSAAFTVVAFDFEHSDATAFEHSDVSAAFTVVAFDFEHSDATAFEHSDVSAAFTVVAFDFEHSGVSATFATTASPLESGQQESGVSLTESATVSLVFVEPRPQAPTRLHSVLPVSIAYPAAPTASTLATPRTTDVVAEPFRKAIVSCSPLA